MHLARFSLTYFPAFSTLSTHLIMKIKVLKEAGYEEALLGISLSYGTSPAGMDKVAGRLSPKDGGHNKFLEAMVVWLDVTAARYWWQQFDTYRTGVTKQSESTMHTLMKRDLTAEDFEGDAITPELLEILNRSLKNKDFDEIKVLLPEGYLQRRIVCMNYKTLRNVIIQRRTHRLEEWQTFIKEVLAQVTYPDLLPGATKDADA
jgi:hypothetical protein